MLPVQPTSKNPKDLANDSSTDLSTQNGQLSSSSKEPKLNDEERLAKIKQELDKLKKETPTPIEDLVKPGSQQTTNKPSTEETKELASTDAKAMADKAQNDVDVGKPPKGINFLNTAMIILGPLFLIGALGFSYYNLKLKPQTPETYVVEMGGEEINIEEAKSKIKQTLTNAPLNPDQATAKCQSTEETIVSGQPSSCPDPVFTWSGEKTREPDTKIIGYWVYFGEKNKTDWLYYYTEDKNLMKTPEEKQEIAMPIVDGELQKSNQFEPSDLEKGKTYHLAVSARSDSQNELWSYGLTEPDPENFRARAAEILFTFVYE